MRLSLLHRVLLVVVPLAITVTVVVSTIWSDHGLLARHQLQGELVQAQAELAEVERENQRLLREIRVMERDPVVLERLVADELRWGRQGDVIYDFGDGESAHLTRPEDAPSPELE